MVTGSPPFTGETPIAVIFKHVNAPVPSPRDANPDISAALEQVILRALEKKPEDRYPIAEELVADLEILMEQPADWPETPSVRPGSSDGSPPAGLKVTFLDSGAEFQLQGKNRYILGRLDGAFQPDIDFGAREGAKFGVSRLHAEIEIKDDGRVEISDLDSTNGTWVNGQQISPEESMRLNHGDMIRVGTVNLQVTFIQ
jgi:serine/threonine protein kinase